ncbi:MAG: RluA family pseudouridine synthase [Clostridiales bacterium]|nr:RluA family pseudouridine synthase [Clostridiales bacterium]
MDIIVSKNDSLIKTIIHSVQGVSFGNAQKMLRKGDIKVNNKRTKQNIQVTVGDKISIYLPTTKSIPKVDIIYEDDNILIVNKPQGIECATRDKSSENTYSLEEIFEDHNAIVIHRLDRLTEGLVILAKTKENAVKFERIFRCNEVHKSYQALLDGKPNTEGEIKAYLYKDSKKALAQVSDTPLDGYKEIITEFKILNSNNNHSLVDINLKTGRTHQIRAQFAHLGTPVTNDSKYGTTLKDSKYKGYFLTAYRLSFTITDDNLKYLNEKTFEITPTWLTYINL